MGKLSLPPNLQLQVANLQLIISTNKITKRKLKNGAIQEGQSVQYNKENNQHEMEHCLHGGERQQGIQHVNKGS